MGPRLQTWIASVAAAPAGAILCLAVSQARLRTKLKGSEWVEVVSWLPRCTLALVVSLGILWAVLLR